MWLYSPNYSWKHIQVFQCLPWLQEKVCVIQQKEESYLSSVETEHIKWILISYAVLLELWRWQYEPGKMSSLKLWTWFSPLFVSLLPSVLFLLIFASVSWEPNPFFKFSCYLRRMMAWIKPFNQRAGKGGTDHKCQGSARKLSDNLNVRNKEGKELGSTGRLAAWGVGQPREGSLGQALAQRAGKKGRRGSASWAETAAQETDYPSSEIGAGKSREVWGLSTREGSLGLWKWKSSFFNLD